MIKNTKHFSKKINSLAKGCKYCVKGSKLVLFITGLCPRHCYYCPISDKKYQKHVTYADEWKVTNINQIIQEAKLIDAEGAGITGGDPLCKLWNTCFAIRQLKNKFGKKFHIHLYTSLNLVTENTLKKLHNAGLDEIRFHPDIDNNKLWHKINLAWKFKWDIGVEIPVIPNKFKQTKKLIDYFHDKICFLNLNELEIADNKVNKLTQLGFKTKNKLSYAIKGSEQTTLKLLKYINKKYPKLNTHYCTAKLKDGIQLRNRIIRRAKNVAKDYDIINKDGTLTRGVIFYKQLSPLKKLKQKYKIPTSLFYIDKKNKRILTSIKVVSKLKKQIHTLKAKPAIIEEYPTADNFTVMVNFL